MAIAAIVLAGDMGKHAHLVAVQRAIGNGNAQHIGVKLQIDAVHQPERLESIFGKLARQAAGYLVAKLRDTVGNKGMVEFVVTVHRSSFP
jgi:hypothetical protein